MVDYNLYSWRGKSIYLTHSAKDELITLSMDMNSLIQALNESMPCPYSRRKKGVYERCTKVYGKAFKIVIADQIHRATKEPCWTVIHIKRYNLKREWRQKK
jgi:hypothetical protein